MHGLQFLHRRIEKACPFIHGVRLKALFKAVGALLSGEQLTLTPLGRPIQGTAFCKHNIKGRDRRLGHAPLHRERFDLYRFMARWLMGRIERPVISVDGSDGEPGHRHLMLKAALPLGGRARSVYEEVPPLKRYHSSKTHRAFLKNLKAVLSEDGRPIIVTDAGFRGPWVKQVERLGWVGRVRDKIKYPLEGSAVWRYPPSLYWRARARATYLGPGFRSRKQPYFCHLDLTKMPKKYRTACKSQRDKKMDKDPGLIATSLPHFSKAAQGMMKISAHRGRSKRLSAIARITAMVSASTPPAPAIPSAGRPCSSSPL